MPQLYGNAMPWGSLGPAEDWRNLSSPGSFQGGGGQPYQDQGPFMPQPQGFSDPNQTPGYTNSPAINPYSGSNPQVQAREGMRRNRLRQMLMGLRNAGREDPTVAWDSGMMRQQPMGPYGQDPLDRSTQIGSDLGSLAGGLASRWGAK